MDETPDPPEAPPRHRWRRRAGVGAGGAVGLTALAHAATGAVLGPAALAATALVAGGAYLVAYPKLKRHLSLPGHAFRPLGGGSGRKSEKRTRTWKRTTGGLNYPGQRGKGFLQGTRKPRTPALFRRGPKSGSGRRGPSFRAPGTSRRRAGLPFRPKGSSGRRSGSAFRPKGSSGRRSRASSSPLSRLRGRGTGSKRRLGPGRQGGRGGPGLRRGSRSGSGRPRRGSGAFRRPGAGGRAGHGSFRRFRPGSGTSRRSRPGSGTSRRFRPGTAAARRGSFRPFPRRRKGAGARPRTGTRPAPARRPGNRPGTGSRPQRKLFRPSTWRRRPGTSLGRSPGTGSRSRRRLFRPSARRRPGATGSPRTRRPGHQLLPPKPAKPRRWFAPWRGRRGPARRIADRYRHRRWQRPARVAARRAHRARIRGWKAQYRRTRQKPRRWWTPWRPRFIPQWRVRHRVSNRLTRWQRWRKKHPGLFRRRPARRRPGVVLRAWFRKASPRRAWIRLRRWRRRRARPPQDWAPRGERWQRQVARFDAWRAGRFRRMFRRRPAQPAASPVPDGTWPGVDPEPWPEPSPEAAKWARRAGQAREEKFTPAPAIRPPGSPTGGKMATSAQVAEGISDLDIDFDDAETLHQVLLHLHEITEAVQGRLNSLADRVAETGLKEKYSDAIKEAASAQSGVGEQLKDVVGGGVLQG